MSALPFKERQVCFGMDVPEPTISDFIASAVYAHARPLCPECQILRRFCCKQQYLVYVPVSLLSGRVWSAPGNPMATPPDNDIGLCNMILVPMTVNLSVCAADRGVATGTLDIIVFFMDTLIFQETDDLCGKTTCPIAPGVISIGYTQPLPPIAPPVRRAGCNSFCALLHTHRRRRRHLPPFVTSECFAFLALLSSHAAELKCTGGCPDKCLNQTAAHQANPSTGQAVMELLQPSAG